MVPAAVQRPILLPAPSVNQRLPSGPTVMPHGVLAAVGIGYRVSVPEVVILSTVFPAFSTNQRVSSGPRVIPLGAVPP